MKKHPITFALMLTASTLFAHSAFACEVPEVKGYDGVDCLYEGYARIMEKGKWNYINRQGQKLSDVNFDYAWEFHEGMAAVEVKNKWGFIDSSGDLIIPLQYDYVWDFRDGKALVQTSSHLFYIDKWGKMVEESTKTR